MPDRENTTFIGIRRTLFGFAACLYDADAGDLQYGAIDYQSEREALAEAEGWSDAECVPLDAHALRLSRRGWMKGEAHVVAPSPVELTVDVDEGVDDDDRDEPIERSRRPLAMG